MLLRGPVELVGELVIPIALNESVRRRGQPHRVRPPGALGALGEAEADVLVARAVLFISSVRHLTGDDR